MHTYKKYTEINIIYSSLTTMISEYLPLPGPVIIYLYYNICTVLYHFHYNNAKIIDFQLHPNYIESWCITINYKQYTTYYKVAKILVKPMPAPNSVCPMPHIMAWMGGIVRFAARYMKATAALLATPDVTGLTTPITIKRTGKNLPYLCFLRVPNATSAAQVWTNTDEHNDHKNTGYHISPNVSNGSPDFSRNISPIESNSDTWNSDNMSYMLS